MWQSKGPRNSAVTGYPNLFAYWFVSTVVLTVGTVNFALKYFKIIWLPQKLTILNLTPHGGLFS